MTSRQEQRAQIWSSDINSLPECSTPGGALYGCMYPVPASACSIFQLANLLGHDLKLNHEVLLSAGNLRALAVAMTGTESAEQGTRKHRQASLAEIF